MKNDNPIKKIFSFSIVRTIVILSIVNILGQCSTGYGNDTLSGVAFVLIVGFALVIEAIRGLKQ